MAKHEREFEIGGAALMRLEAFAKKYGLELEAALSVIIESKINPGGSFVDSETFWKNVRKHPLMKGKI